MKTKVATMIFASFLFWTAAGANANLIDFTPGGFTIHETPSFVNDWLTNVERNLTGFDVAVLNYPGFGTGWLGNGFVPGGTYFGTDLFSFTQNPTSCSISWNFPNYPNPTNWELSWIWVQGTPGGDYWNNIYQVPLDQLLAGDGTITLNGITGIYAISFLGQHIRDVPDDSNAGALFVLAISVLLLMTLPAATILSVRDIIRRITL